MISSQEEMRQRGYMALRLGRERKLVEAMGLEEGDYESHSPGPKSWRPLDELAVVEFDAEAEADRQLAEALAEEAAEEAAAMKGKWIREAQGLHESLRARAAKARTMYELRMLISESIEWDNAHPGLKDSWNFISRAFERREQELLDDQPKQPLARLVWQRAHEAGVDFVGLMDVGGSIFYGSDVRYAKHQDLDYEAVFRSPPTGVVAVDGNRMLVWREV